MRFELAQFAERWKMRKQHARDGASIEDPAQYFSELGNLHDAKIGLIEWNLARGELSFVVNDIYSNFRGLPGYLGPQPVQIVLAGVAAMEVRVSATTMTETTLVQEPLRDPINERSILHRN
jgi:hypothetical protein